MRFADLFCGIGGARLGVEEALRRAHLSYECVFSCDIKKSALRAYNAYFGERNEPTDIRQVTRIPDIDLVVGGFPCQPFSTAGKRRGLEDARGNLYLEIMRILEAKRPPLVVLENVSNLGSMDAGRVIEGIRDHLVALGYHVVWHCFDARDYGVPQKRLRLFIVASLFHAFSDNDAFAAAVAAHKQPVKCLGDVLDRDDVTSDVSDSFVDLLRSVHPDLGALEGVSIKDRRGGDDNLHSWDIGYHGDVEPCDKLVLNTLLLERRKKKYAAARGTPGKDGVALTPGELELVLGVEDLTHRLEHLADQGYLVRRAGGTYDLSKGKLSFPISKILRTDEPSPTLTATDASKLGVIVGQTLRRLNTRELARLSGFPENFPVTSRKDAYDLFGNCICPPVMQAILAAVLAARPSYKEKFRKA